MTGSRASVRTRSFVVAAVGVALWLAVARPAAAAEVVFPAVADTTARSAAPTVTGGVAHKVLVDGSPETDAYLRFQVSGLDGAVTSATLQLYPLSSQRRGLDVHTVADDSWVESTLTYTTAPPFDPAVIGSSGRATAGTWLKIDVTPVVVGAGSYDFALTTPSVTRLALASREYGNGFAPQLVVETTGSSALPANVTPPTASGTAAVAATLTATPGAWDGTPPFDYGYQWLRCDGSGGSCQPITGATAATYTLTADDAGSTLRVIVTASNATGAASSTSAPTAVVAAAPAPAAAPCGTVATAPVYRHVIWIMLENHAYQQVVGSAQAPYVNELAAECGLATSYFAITHPSLPNYIAATSGDTQGVTDDAVPPANVTSADNIFAQVAAAGEAWAAYEESMPSNCSLADAGDYSAHHNPAIYYSNVRAACATADVPLGTTTAGPLADALANGTLPAFAFLTPNLVSDMHNGTVAQGDGWLSQWIPAIVSSPAYQAGDTVVFVTWDEDDHSAANQVPLLVISPSTAPGTTSSTTFDHYSLLQTTEQLLGLPLLGHAGDASTASLAGPFNLGP